MKTPKPLEQFIYSSSFGIGTFCSALVFIGAIGGTLSTFSSFVDSYQAKLEALNEAASQRADQLLSSKIDFLLEVISSGAWPRLELAATDSLQSPSSLLSCSALGSAHWRRIVRAALFCYPGQLKKKGRNSSCIYSARQL
jgi:hypothetical protein